MCVRCFPYLVFGSGYTGSLVLWCSAAFVVESQILAGFDRYSHLR